MSRRSPERGASTEALLQKTFALNLRAARKSKGMTQAEVAKAIGVSTTVFWRYEGARMWPSIETLRGIRPTNPDGEACDGAGRLGG